MGAWSRFLDKRVSRRDKHFDTISALALWAGTIFLGPIGLFTVDPPMAVVVTTAAFFAMLSDPRTLPLIWVASLYLAYEYSKRLGSPRIRKKKEFTIQEPPEGWCVYRDAVFYARGVNYRKDDVIAWASGDNLSLIAKREPANRHDPNAIAIFGRSDGRNRKIGYVPREIAAILPKDTKIRLNLLGVEICADRTIVEFEIWVPCANCE